MPSFLINPQNQLHPRFFQSYITKGRYKKNRSSLVSINFTGVSKMTNATNNTTPASDYITSAQMQEALSKMKAEMNKKATVTERTLDAIVKIGGITAFIAGFAAAGIVISKKISERNSDTAE